MKKSLIGLLLLGPALLFTGNSFSQGLIQKNSETAKMSSSRLENIDDLIHKYIDENKIPSSVFLIARGGNIIYHKAIGIKNSVTDEPYQIGDIFRITSMSKAIATVSILQLFMFQLWINKSKNYLLMNQLKQVK